MATRPFGAFKHSLGLIAEKNPTNKAGIDFCLSQIKAITKSDQKKYLASRKQRVRVQAVPDRVNVQLQNAIPQELLFWTELQREMDSANDNRRGLEVVATMVFNAAETSKLLPQNIAQEAIKALSDRF